jgi:hypothetical protein
MLDWVVFVFWDVTMCNFVDSYQPSEENQCLFLKERRNHFSQTTVNVCSFLFQNGLKHGDVLSPLLFKTVMECAIRKVPDNKEGMILNGSHQLLVYVDDVNSVGENVHIVQKNTPFLLVTGKKAGLEANRKRYIHLRTVNRTLHKTTQRLSINPLKMWHSSDIWERH